MPTERVAMRRVREMLRLSRDGGLGIPVMVWTALTSGLGVP